LFKINNGCLIYPERVRVSERRPIESLTYFSLKKKKEERGNEQMINNFKKKKKRKEKEGRKERE